MFDAYCEANDEGYNVLDSYCPLIVYSPNILHKTEIEDVAYQMDIYLTLLSLIHCQSRWKGFGVDLLDKEAQDSTRNVMELEEISDKIIRANYFERILQ